MEYKKGMKNNYYVKYTTYFHYLAFSLLLFSPCSYAQITTDNTLKNSTTISKNSLTTTIDGGSQIGANLFHSFKSFNVKNNEIVHFNNKNHIKNIFTRVIGSSRSNINGVIRANDTSNLFFINPYGILFGPNSSLEIGGSFLATTADSIQFSNGYIFSSSKKNFAPTLAVKGPYNLRFLNNTASIRNQSIKGLSVLPNRTISLIGGKLLFDEGNVNAPDGNIFLASLEAKNIASFSQAPSSHLDLQFSIKNNLDFQNIAISNLSIVDVSGERGGNIHIFGKNINLSKGSRIQSITSGSRTGGLIYVYASESLSLKGNNNLNSPIDKRFARNGFLIPQKTTILSSTSGLGQSASIKIHAKSLSISDGADISNSTDSFGSSGDISIDVPTSIHIYGETPIIDLIQESIPFKNPITRNFLIDASISSTIRTRTRLDIDGGRGGDIKINAGNLILANGGNIATGSDKGQGGNLNIDVSGNIDIFGSTKSGNSTSFFSAATNASNNASALSIQAKNLFLREGGIITVSTFSTGKGGNISISIADTLKISGISRNGNIPSQINSGSFDNGNAGTLQIKTNRFVLEDRAELSASTFSFGKGGNISIQSEYIQIIRGGKILTSSIGFGDAGSIKVSAMKSALIDGHKSGLFANTQGKAKGGDIFIKASNFSVTNGGKLVTTTSGSQSAGNITLEVLDSITLDGIDSGLFANTTIRSTGPGGSISIDPRLVSIQDGAKISVNSEGNGRAGSIFLESENLSLDRGTISASSKSNIGGNISLLIDNLLLLRNESELSTTANGSGTGGNIEVNSPLIVAYPSENSDITANAFQGRGGKITITTKGIFGIKERSKLTELSDITAVSENTQLNGTVSINTPEVDPSGNLSELPVVIDRPQEIVQGCRPGQALGGSSFVNVGRGGLPTSPYESQTATNVWQDLREHKLKSPTAAAIPPSTSVVTPPSPKIVEAKGWIKDSQGRIHLTANMHHPSDSPLTATTTCSSKISN